MKKIVERINDKQNIQKLMKIFPVTAILGPRQCGKTFLAKMLKYDYFYDLEKPTDLVLFEQPQLALENLKGIIVIDEIQRKPNLFPTLRYLIDTRHNSQKYLILGSASKELIKQSSESLAGRIGYYYLSGFSLSDVGKENLNKLWLRGTLPLAFLASSDNSAFIWLSNYVTTFLERDIPQLGITIPAGTLRKFWMMLCHYNANIINYSEIGRGFGISDTTVKKYIDILTNTFMIRQLQPWYVNIGKRLVKNPKIYFKDTGIFHSLLSIENFRQLQTNPKLGASWESFALEIVAKSINKKPEELFFFRTHAGSELDLFWQQNRQNWG